MASKKEEKKPVDTSGFQLNPDNFKVGNMLLDGFIKNAIKDVNKADFNHNGVADISEIAPLVTKALPLLVALNRCIDFNKLSVELSGSQWVKDKTVFKQILTEFSALAEASEKVLPH